VKRVTGIGGIFFKAENPKSLYEWYEKHLGIIREPHGQGAELHWREDENPERRGTTVWSLFEKHSKYFGSNGAQFMLNYRVDDLDALLEALRAECVDRSEARRCRLRPVCLDHRPGGQQNRAVGAAKRLSWLKTGTL
jgi:hypothetical protein